MIVNCPKCEFEQPIDEYCAQCGAPLRKLVELERLKRKNSSNLPIYLTAFAFFIVAGAWLSLQLKESPNTESMTFIDKEDDSTNVRVSLKSAKIKADRKKQERQIKEIRAIKAEPLNIAKSQKPFKKSSLTAIKNLSLSKPPNTDKAESSPVEEISSASPIEFKKLSLISLSNCENTNPVNKLDARALKKLRSCSYVISTKTFSGSGEFLEQGESFETILSWELEDESISLNASFSSETSEGTQTESSNLVKEDETRALIFSNPFIGLVEKENLGEDAKANIFTSALFGLSDKENLTFFLISE